MAYTVFGWLVAAALLWAAIPAALFAVNLRLYRPPAGLPFGLPDGLPSGLPAGLQFGLLPGAAAVSVLIPARDEERNIAACLEAVLANAPAGSGLLLEALVLDDASTDRTGAIVRSIAARDARVRVVATQTLPAGWNGKQRALWLLAQEAGAPLLLFLDADVRLAPGAIARCVATMQQSGVRLLSGFPRQRTVGWLEQMLIPLIHFVLLGFLPIAAMRRGTRPAMAAGCGQFFLAERAAYFACGGHEAIRETRHDGLRLPQAFRRAGYRTDIVDLTGVATVRMYDSAGAVWSGLAKNATEGIGAPGRIVPFTLMLGLGQVLPVVLAALWGTLWVSMAVVGARFDEPGRAAWISAGIVLAVALSYLPRLLAIRRFRQPVVAALLHPLGVALLLSLQWYALGRQVIGRPVAWRARRYASGSGEEIG